MQAKILLPLAFVGLLFAQSTLRADAKGECQLETVQAKTFPGHLVYVKNTNAGRRIQVTVSVTIAFRNPPHFERARDIIVDLAPGGRFLCGGDTGPDYAVAYAVQRAEYR